MGWRRFNRWMALAELDGWDQWGQVAKVVLAHVKATIHNEMLPLLKAHGYQISQTDVRTPQDYIGGRRVQVQAPDEMNAAINHIAGIKET